MRSIRIHEDSAVYARDPARRCLALLRSSTPLRSAQDDTGEIVLCKRLCKATSFKQRGETTRNNPPFLMSADNALYLTSKTVTKIGCYSEGQFYLPPEKTETAD